MTRPIFLSLIPVLSLCACARGDAVEAAAPRPAPDGPAFARAVLIADPPADPARAAARLPSPAEQRLPSPARNSRKGTGAPVSRVEAANRAALREPQRDAYVNAVQVYAWTEGALYRLYTAPERVSEIALQKGEALISVAAGDTARWVIGDTTSGTGAARRTHILVKPSLIGLHTNLVITTDRRVYHVQLESTPRTAMASISWTYPEGELMALRRSGDAAANDLLATSLSVEALNFRYSIEGDDPAWRPVRAFDDGSQVFIEFPASFGQSEAPPLFVLGPDNRAELVNYRVRGRYYVVDRLFKAAELRLGEKRQQVVRVSRQERSGPRPRRGRTS